MLYQFKIQYGAKEGEPFEDIMTCSFEAKDDDHANEIAEAVFSLRERFRIRPGEVYFKTKPSIAT